MKKKQTTLVILVVLLLCAAAGAYWFYSNREVPETFFDYSPGDYFVTNVKDSKRLFKVSVVLRLTTDDDKVIAEVFTRNNALIRDIIIFTLREMNEGALVDIDMQDRVREQLRLKIGEALGTDLIGRVLFNDYVMQ